MRRPRSFWLLPCGFLIRYTSLSITNYGVATSLQCDVWFVSIVICSYNIPSLSPSSEVAGDPPNWFGMGLANNEASFYGVTPAVATVALAEVLIMNEPSPEHSHHLCCQPVFVDSTAVEQNACAIGLNFIIGKLYANSLLASLNTRKHLRSRSSGTESVAVERIDTVHFANLPRLSGDEESSKDGVKRFDAHGIAIVDNGAAVILDKAVALRIDRAV
ncbi:hypothetical protein EDD17DRAFT_1511559 [Pisolithus thermaeus]|nr:hypothetical protein EDD17DRAFT_1511559 [Pisolithus thermaeus]